MSAKIKPILMWGHYDKEDGQLYGDYLYPTKRDAEYARPWKWFGVVRVKVSVAKPKKATA